MKEYQLTLSPFQIEVLLDTVQGFVDNKKLIHMPDHTGAIVALPLTEQMLQDIHKSMKKRELGGQQDILIGLDSAETNTSVNITIIGEEFKYTVNLREFDEQ